MQFSGKKNSLDVRIRVFWDIFVRIVGMKLKKALNYGKFDAKQKLRV